MYDNFLFKVPGYLLYLYTVCIRCTPQILVSCTVPDSIRKNYSTVVLLVVILYGSKSTEKIKIFKKTVHCWFGL